MTDDELRALNPGDRVLLGDELVTIERIEFLDHLDLQPMAKLTGWSGLFGSTCFERAPIRLLSSIERTP